MQSVMSHYVQLSPVYHRPIEQVCNWAAVRDNVVDACAQAVVDSLSTLKEVKSTERNLSLPQFLSVAGKISKLANPKTFRPVEDFLAECSSRNLSP